jgi:hypothetical protein
MEKMIIEKLVNLEAMLLSLKQIVVDTPEKTEVFKQLNIENLKSLEKRFSQDVASSLETKPQPPL